MTPRRLAPGDPALAQVLDLLHKAFAYMEGRIDPPSSLHRLTVEALDAQAATGEVWAIGAPPCASIVLTPQPGALYLGKLAVAPAWRGRALARRLIDLAERRAQHRGLPALELQSRVELAEIHAIFRHLGFVETGRTAHSGYDRPTSITFRRAVPALNTTGAPSGSPRRL